MGGAVSTVTNVVTQAVNTVTKTVENVVHNPLPVIETVALTSIGLPPSVASAAVSAANGGNVQQIATAAAAGYVGGQASSAAGETVALQGADPITVKIASSAAGASASATAGALASGKTLGEALSAGVTAAGQGLVSSAETAGIGAATQAVSDVLPSGSETLAEARKDVNAVLDPIKQAIPGVTKKDIQTEVNPILDPIKQALPTVTKKDIANLTPQIPSSLLKTGQSVGDTILKDVTGAAAKVADQTYGSDTSGQLFAPTAGTSGSTSTPAPTGTATQTTASPGSQALAQALNVGDLSGPLFDKTGGTPKNVWNQASLRVKDETGST
jgi:hypothetical protein